MRKAVRCTPPWRRKERLTAAGRETSDLCFERELQASLTFTCEQTRSDSTTQQTATACNGCGVCRCIGERSAPVTTIVVCAEETEVSCS